MLSEKLGERIKERRVELGLSLATLSEMSGISKSTLQRYEADSSKMKQSQIANLAKALNVTPLYLLGMESKEIPFTYLNEITPLFQKLGFAFEYDFDNDSYKLVNQTSNQFIILHKDDLLKLKTEILSFVEFQLSKLFNS